MFGYSDNSYGFGTTTSDSAIGCLIKGCTDTHFAGGKHSLFTSVGGQLKGSTDSSINNSLFILDSANGDALLANVNGAVNNATSNFRQNLVVATENTTGKFVDIGTSQDVALSLNAYHELSGVTLPTNLMSFQGSNYTTKADYQAAQETDAIIADPDIDSNYIPNSTSPLIGTGSKWWTGPNPIGNNGEPFSDIDTDIGSVQSTYGPFHPKNL